MSLDYYDPRRQEQDWEHDLCVLEEGVWWFGHGMECRRPELHREESSDDRHLPGDRR